MQSQFTHRYKKGAHVQEELPNGSMVAPNQTGRLLFRMASDCIILSYVNFIPGLNLNTIFYSTLDEKGVAAAKNGVCRLSRCRDVVVFAKIDKRPSNKLFITTILPNSSQNIAGNGPSVMRKRNHGLELRQQDWQRISSIMVWDT